MNKTLIRTRFAKNLKTYEKNAVIQKQMAQKLLELITETKFDNILEVGCGTGFLTKLARDKFQFKNYIANDIVEDCARYILPYYTDVNFISGDIETIIQNSKNAYDLIISNAALQWVDDIETCIKNILTALKPNGILLFSTFGKQNFKEIFQLTGKTLNYKSPEEYDVFFKNNYHIIKDEICTLTFKTPKEILQHLKQTGVNALETTVWTKTDLLQFEKNYTKLSSSLPSLTYNPVYILAAK